MIADNALSLTSSFLLPDDLTLVLVKVFVPNLNPPRSLYFITASIPLAFAYTNADSSSATLLDISSNLTPIVLLLLSIRDTSSLSGYFSGNLLHSGSVSVSPP